MNNISFRSVSVGALAALLSLSLVAFADASGGPGGGRPGGIGGPPGGMPGGARIPTTLPPVIQPNSRNPNGTPPVGKSTSAPDTARGRSEGKGQTDTTSHGKPVVGKVASFNGSTLTLTLPNGTTKTFTVDPHAFGQLKPKQGQNVAVEMKNGSEASSVVAADQTIRGTVTASSLTSVTIKLPNGQTRTISVAPQAATRMKLSPGVPVTIVSHDGGASAAAISIRH